MVHSVPMIFGAVRASYGRNHARLVDVKTAYDPDNAFRVNANIAPRR